MPTRVSRSSVKKAKITGGTIARIGKKIFQISLGSSSLPKRLLRLLRSVTVIIGNEVERVRTGNKPRKYRITFELQT